MNIFYRVVVSFAVFVATYMIFLFTGGDLLYRAVGIFAIDPLSSLVVGIVAALWAWRKLGDDQSGISRMPAKWTVIIGAIGFVGGFLGPMIFTPHANQGPLLGIFITGPLGVVIGAFIDASRKKSESAET